jgi:hypothetical protein
MMTNDQLDIALKKIVFTTTTKSVRTNILVDAEKDLTDIKGKSIAIASAVTSFARMELYHVMSAIISKGFRIMYSDTDSIITDCNLSNHDDLMKRFMWDGCGKALGALKNECLDKVEGLISKGKFTKQQLVE